MAKPKPQDIDEQIAKEEPFNTGSDTISSHSPSPDSDDDTAQALEDVLGNAPKHNENIAEEINKDEEEVLEKPINDYKDDPAPPLASQNEIEQAQVQDPWDALTDDDIPELSKKKKTSK